MDRDRKHQIAENTNLGGNIAAGTVGSAFGAAKLRDLYREDHPQKFQRAVTRASRGAPKLGVTPHRAAKLAHWAEHAKPRFEQVATATALGLTAAGAQHYDEHLKHLDARDARRARAASRTTPGASVSKSAFGITHPDEQIAKAKKTKAGMSTAATQAPGTAGKTKAPKSKPSTPAPPNTRGKLRAVKATPAMPQADELFGRLVSPALRAKVASTMGAGGSAAHLRGPMLAAAGGGVLAGGLIASHHRDLSKGANTQKVADAFRRNAPVIADAGKKLAASHAKYIAGAAGVGTTAAVGALAAKHVKAKAPAAIDRAVVRAFPMPKASPALAGAAALGGGALLLAHDRRKREDLGKSAFGVQHPDYAVA